MVIKQVELQHVCGITSKLPDTGQVEVAFAGKSNVGKSSLINALMNRKSLARTSAQPGKTQTINYYHINEEMYLVDLPGYGFARASEEVKAKWGKLIEDYLHQSKMLHAVFLLIDIRSCTVQQRSHHVQLDSSKRLSADHHCDEAGQDQAQPASEADQADPRDAGG